MSRSNTRIPHYDKPEEKQFISHVQSKREGKHDDNNNNNNCCNLLCSKKFPKTLARMLDFSLLKSPIFILFTVSNFFTSIGFNIPYVYIVVKINGISKTLPRTMRNDNNDNNNC